MRFTRASRNTHLAVLGMVLVLGACMPDSESVPPIEAPRRSPELIIEEGVIRFEGKVLPLGADSLDPWEEVLGVSRTGDTSSWYVWDEHGLSVQFVNYAQFKRPLRVTSLRVHFEPNQHFGPKKMFSGTLVLDGTHFHSEMNSFPRDKPCRFARGKPFRSEIDCDRGPYNFSFTVDHDDRLRFFEIGVRVAACEELWTTGTMPIFPSVPAKASQSRWPF